MNKPKIIPLIKPGPLYWEEWKERWEACTDYPTAAGLLHAVFDTEIGKPLYHGSYENEVERICLMLDIADGHRVHGISNKEVREQAFVVLTTQFFKKCGYDSITNLGPEVRQKLLWFFRAEGQRDFMTRNVSWVVYSKEEYLMQLASRYLEQFCTFMWRAGHLRLEILELLYAYRELLTFLPGPLSSGMHDWDPFTDEVEAKLEELMLRDAASIEEGVLLGSQAARLLIQVRAGRAELARRKEKAELEANIAAQQERLKML